MLSPDVVRLRHMREAAAAAMEMALDHDRPALDNTLVLAMALTRCLEILGEAASKVSSEMSAKFPTIPFQKMISMRNHLIHAYFDVDLDIVWTTVQEDLPPLLKALDQALAQIDA